MTGNGQRTDIAAIHEAAGLCVLIHQDLEDEFAAIRRTRDQLYAVWQSRQTSQKHSLLMDGFEKAFQAEQQKIDEIKQLLDKWGTSMEEAVAQADRHLDSVDLAVGPGGSPAAPAATAGGYLERISSGETVAGGQTSA